VVKNEYEKSCGVTRNNCLDQVFSKKSSSLGLTRWLIKNLLSQ